MARRREKIPHRKKARQLLTGTFRVVRSGQASVETPEGVFRVGISGHFGP